MTDPTRVHVDVPEVDNRIEMGEILRGLRDFAAQRTGPAVALRSGAGLVPDRDLLEPADLTRVQELAAELAELVDRIPDLAGTQFRRPAGPSA